MCELLTMVETHSEWTGLSGHFKPAKCASLTVDFRGRRRVQDTWFSIRGEEVKALREGEEYRHLGAPTGFKVDQTTEVDIQNMTSDVEKIQKSPVTVLLSWRH